MAESDTDEDIREPRLIDFIHNDGSYAHRGVWHVTENLTVEHHPARETTRELRPGRKVTHRFEETTTYRGDAICGQASRLQQGGHDWARLVKEESTEDHPVYLSRRVRHPSYIRTTADNAPGPLCSRCARKAGVWD